MSATAVGPSLRNVSKALSQIHSEKRFLFHDDADHLSVRCDQEDFEEIIANLFDNAGKWASAEIHTHVEAKDGRVSIVIEDDGPGMAGDSIERAFEFGERLDERLPGSGLGLAIVKDLVNAYDGHVSLGRSNLGGLSAKVTLREAESKL